MANLLFCFQASQWISFLHGNPAEKANAVKCICQESKCSKQTCQESKCTKCNVHMHCVAQRLKGDAGGGAVQQAPEASIGTLEGSMQRGASLNVPPPVARTAGGLKGNWGLFWGAVQRDHCHAGLIWNEGTRAELREALQVRSDCFLTPPESKLCLISKKTAWTHQTHESKITRVQLRFCC